MKLIRKLNVEKDKKGYLRSYGLFLCPYCLQKIKKILYNGKTQKSCGKKKCRPKYNQGKNHPFYEKHLSKEHRRKISIINKGKSRSEKSKEKMSKTRIKKGLSKGSNNPNWNNGSSFEPYSPEFNKELKDFIKQRDLYICQTPNCINTEYLCIHHIDYNKKNNEPNNLIVLCISCHMKTNAKKKRKYYQNYYNEIVSIYL